jgi:hypothetical protein
MQSRSCPKDHYIAQTYLKRFVGKNGFLQAYRKSDGKTFPCRPYDISHEADGDIIPNFMEDNLRKLDVAIVTIDAPMPQSLETS